MIYLNHPSVILLAVPAWFAYRRWWPGRGPHGLVRIAVAAVLILIAAGPLADAPDRGTTVVMVFDRSRSMPPAADRFAKDLIRRAESEQGQQDLIAAVGFGAAPAVELFPRAGHPPETSLKQIDREWSNLHAGVGAALELIPRGTRGRLLVVSDGAADDELSEELTAQLRGRGVPVLFLHGTRRSDGDAAITALRCPAESDAGSESSFDFEFTATEPAAGSLQIRRNGEDLQSQPVELAKGVTPFTWRDKHESTGVVRYSFSLNVSNDPTVENNQWETWVQVRGTPAVLVLNADGDESPLVTLARRSGASVEVVAAKRGDLAPERLGGYAAVLLDDVPSSELSPASMQAIVQHVEQFGGGLVVAGGPNGIGAGGYRFNLLEPLLPARLRSLSAFERPPQAIVILVDPGAWESSADDSDEGMSPLQKAVMKLGEELDVADRLGIVATRSSDPVLMPLASTAKMSDVRSAVSEFGLSNDPTSFPRALVAANDMLAKASQPQKHLLVCVSTHQIASWQALGSDSKLASPQSNTTTTIISWGTPPEWWSQGVVGKSSKSRLLSTSDSNQLVDLFRQDWELSTGGSFVDRATAMLAVTEAGLIDPAIDSERLPTVGGFHPATLRIGSRAALVRRDSVTMPLTAQGERGLGRTTAFLFPVLQGQSSDAEWDLVSKLLAEQIAWTARLDRPERLPLAVARDAHEVTVSLQLTDVDVARLPGSGPLQLVAADTNTDVSKGGSPVKRSFRREGDSLVARLTLERTSSIVPVIERGGAFIARCAPVALPRSREFLSSVSPARGRAVLEQLADLTGGGEWTEEMPLFDAPSRANRSLVALLAWIAVALVLIDVADRRHQLLDRLESDWRHRVARPATSAEAKPALVTDPTQDAFNQAKERTKQRLKR